MSSIFFATSVGRVRRVSTIWAKPGRRSDQEATPLRALHPQLAAHLEQQGSAVGQDADLAVVRREGDNVVGLQAPRCGVITLQWKVLPVAIS